MKILVGYTGFVGSNLHRYGDFDKVFNSKNVKESFGLNPDLLVYAGVRAEKFLANKDKELDFKLIEEAFQNIKEINPKKIILISTIDVYKNPINVDENTNVDTQGLHPYGYNRYLLEEMVKEHFERHLIVRLPGLFGINIKKNFIFDAIHIIPSMLTEDKYHELSEKSLLISQSYLDCHNGFFKCKILTPILKAELKQTFMEIGFSALNFTDSRGIFQFYNLRHLHDHIQKALDNDIKLLNLATEPLEISEIYLKIFEKSFDNKLDKSIPIYNFKTIHDKIFDGENGYIFSKERVIDDICVFVKEELEYES